jgi:hypothetical protein
MHEGLPSRFLTFLLDPKVIHFCASAARSSAGRDLCFRLPSNCTRNCTAAQRFEGPLPVHFPKGIFKIGYELVDWHSAEQQVRCALTLRAPTTHTKACTMNKK